MKKHHNTLYVTTQGAYLSVEGENVVVKEDQDEKMRVPLHLLENIVCFGRVSCSPFLMGACGEKGIGVAFLTENNRFLARVQGPVSGNVLLRREQYRKADDRDFSSRAAKTFLSAKILNCRTVLLRHLRDHPESEGRESVRLAAEDLGNKIGGLEKAYDLDVVRGIEGDAANSYFGVFDHLIVSKQEGFAFNGRTRRPPMDNVNALLSFLYVLLSHDASSSLEAVGLDPQVGFLHRDRPGRPSLALDLIEEFRPFFADRLALSLINRRQIKSKGFEKTEAGGFIMDDETRKTVLIAYQERKKEEIKHPFLDETTTVGMLVHLQALLLARFLREDLDGYPPFIWK